MPSFDFAQPLHFDGVQEAVLQARQRAQVLAKDRALLRRLIAHIDLTTLAGDDTKQRVQKLAEQAVRPLSSDPTVHCGAVCVYPARVADVKEKLDALNSSIPIASVAAGFPSGQFHLQSRLLEIELAVKDGASEIDIVISRPLALADQWDQLGDEIKQMKEKCGQAHLKAILATGELGTPERIYRAAWACMLNGADFVKTSTGKESVNATPEVAYVMLRAIADFHRAHPNRARVGFKPAGGLRTPLDALTYYALVEQVLGQDWLTPALFRLGASSLLDNLVKELS